MKHYDKMIIDPDKTYRVVIGGRGNGRMFFLYTQRQKLLKIIGQVIREGHIQLHDDEERANNAYMVALIKSCEEMRKRNPRLTDLH